MNAFSAGFIAAQIHCMDGRHMILQKIEDDPDGGLRMYLMSTCPGEFATVEDPESIERLRHAMMFDAPVCVPTPPPECRFQDRAPERLFPPWHP